MSVFTADPDLIQNSACSHLARRCFASEPSERPVALLVQNGQVPVFEEGEIAFAEVSMIILAGDDDAALMIQIPDFTLDGPSIPEDFDILVAWQQEYAVPLRR